MLMDCVLSGLQWLSYLMYLDNVIVFNATFEEHLENLDQVFFRLQKAGLKLKYLKCSSVQDHHL